MRSVAQVFLTVFFITFFFMVSIASVFKFQILNNNFWIASFEKNNVYNSLSVFSKEVFEKQIVANGANIKEVKDLGDLINENNAREIVNRNLSSVFSYLNGVNKEIVVYVPLDKIPEDLYAKKLTGFQTEMELTNLLSKLGFSDTQALGLYEFFGVGNTFLYFIAFGVGVIFVILICLIVLVEKGERFISLGISFVLSGIIIFLLTMFVSSANLMAQNQIQETQSIIESVIFIVVPALIKGIVDIWRPIALVSVAIGVSLFFVKKPGYNKLR